MVNDALVRVNLMGIVQTTYIKVKK